MLAILRFVRNVYTEYCTRPPVSPGWVGMLTGPPVSPGWVGMFTRPPVLPLATVADVVGITGGIGVTGGIVVGGGVFAAGPAAAAVADVVGGVVGSAAAS